MSPDPDTQRAPLAVDELARVVLELAAQPDLAALAARFTECVRAWAAPSALVAAARGSEPGSWRVLPALSFGSLPLGIERALQQLVDDVPECLARPAVQQPLEPLAGVRLRDNWIVPWWCEGESGLLLLRGVPRPWPPNLGEALALVSAPVWPRLLGGPAARVESLVAQLQQVSGRLQLEAGRELERLQAAAAAVAAAGREAEDEADAPPAADPAEIAALQEKAARLEQELRAATDQLNAANEQQRSLNEQQRSLNEQLRAAADEAAQLRGQAAQLQEQVASLQQQAARQAEENAALAQRLHGLEEQRGTVRVAEARARVAEEALAAAQEAIASHAGVLRNEREATVARIEEHRRALEAAEQRALDGEQELAAARRDLEAHSELLDAERAAVEREQQQRQASEAGAAALRQASESLRAQLQAAQAELAAAHAERAAGRAQLESAEEELAAARADLAAAQGRAAAEQERARSADETLAVVRTALVSLHRSAFVPSGLRFALEDVSAAVGSGAPRRVEGMRLVILDRDLGGLESLAGELEAGGLDVRIANYPEELALLLRTPGGRDVVAAICDVMAFRPDQNIAGLFRSWEKDRPGLAFFLSYDADSSVELERARRVPLSLTLAHLPRPLPAKRVGEAIELLARRQARP